MPRQGMSRGSSLFRLWLARVLIAIGLVLILAPLAQLGLEYARQQLVIWGIIEIAGDPVIAVPPPAGGLGVGSEPPGAPEPGANGPGPVEPGTGPPGAVEPSVPAVQAELTIRIPRINLTARLYEGVTKEALKQGPGIYPQGAYPGEPGNLAIAGHRTSAGAPFLLLNRLRAGDQVLVITGSATYVYEVESLLIVESSDWSVIAPTEYQALTLTTCHPMGSTRQRLVVRGRLTRVEATSGPG